MSRMTHNPDAAALAPAAVPIQSSSTATTRGAAAGAQDSHVDGAAAGATEDGFTDEATAGTDDDDVTDEASADTVEYDGAVSEDGDETTDDAS